MSDNNQNQHGFTLAELTVVMVLIGILVSFTYTFFNMTIAQYFTLQRDGDAFYSLSQNYQRLANVLRGITGITSASDNDLICYAYFAPDDTYVSQIHYYISGGNMLADVTPMTANPPSGSLLTSKKKTFTIIEHFYARPGINTFTYMDANATVLTTPVSDLNSIKGIKVSLAVSSVAPNTDTQALTIQISIRNRKTNL
ncbi:MAG: pilus assembly FimT family protein [Candidatus Saccharimonadales bacterium]